MVAPKARENFDFGTMFSVNIPINEMYFHNSTADWHTKARQTADTIARQKYIFVSNFYTADWGKSRLGACPSFVDQFPLLRQHH